MSDNELKKVLVLGSTGSIGTQSLDVISQHPERFVAYGLVARSNVDLMFAQCLDYHPRFAVLIDESAARDLRERLAAADCGTEVLVGADASTALAADAAVDVVIAGIVGAAGLPATFAAAQSGKRILLANKEALVMAGDLFMRAVREHGAELMPVDSEHNAVFQAFPPYYKPGDSLPLAIDSIVLTASGGPFLSTPLGEMVNVTPQQAVAHPTWRMGAKISVDSATMMNKALEVIEAHFLFSLPADRINVWVHPQSIVHALVQYQDGSTLAQLGEPDMRTPITHCLAWPHRVANSVAALDLLRASDLSFLEVEKERYPCFQFGYDVLSMGQSAITALNAVNEVAVNAFLARRIGYADIVSLIDKVLDRSKFTHLASLADVMEMDRVTRERAKQELTTLSCA